MRLLQVQILLCAPIFPGQSLGFDSRTVSARCLRKLKAAKSDSKNYHASHDRAGFIAGLNGLNLVNQYFPLQIMEQFQPKPAPEFVGFAPLFLNQLCRSDQTDARRVVSHRERQ